jgi:hypothetical protein
MSRMLDLIKASKVPAAILQLAARGALAVPTPEMLEILVYLTHNPIFGDQAKLTLAGWEEKSALSVLGDPDAPADVLSYFIAPDNIRTGLLPTLLENPSVSTTASQILAANCSPEVARVLARSARVRQTPTVVAVLLKNPNYTPEEGATLEMPDASLLEAESQPAASEFHEHHSEEPAVAYGAEQDSDEVLQVLTAFERQHAAEIAAEGHKPFQPLGGFVTELELKDGPEETATDAASPAHPAGAVPHSVAVAAAAKKKEKEKSQAGEKERISTLQKIARLDVKGRIHLAVRGNKEERSILIRDGTKLVALAVLESPKISDGEVEGFASQKNVLEAVLRGIPMKRRFAKNYTIMRNLVFNPRTPLDTSLGLMKNLLVNDLKNLSGNKEVSETIRKMALRNFRQKAQGKG